MNIVLSPALIRQLPDVLDYFEGELDGVEDVLAVKGKLLDHALKEQASCHYKYERLRVELKKVVKFMETLVDSTRGKLARKYVENYSRTLNERTMNAYIDNEDEFCQIKNTQLEVEELYEKYVAVSEAFTKRGFALRDITALRIHQMENSLL